MPFFRYQKPSRVRQTSSASIFAPLARMMTGLPPRLLPIPGPLVETGSTLVLEWEVAMLGDDFGVGDGEGDGESEGDGDGEGKVSGVASGVAVTGISVEACTFCCLDLVSPI